MRTTTMSIVFLSLVAALGCSKKPQQKKTLASAAAPVERPGPAVEATPNLSPETSLSVPVPTTELKRVLYFEFDSTNLSDQARERLQNNAAWMKEVDTRTLTIEGHTDEAGTSDYNLALGERRAQITRDYLVRLGVPTGRIQIITYGEERPAGGVDSQNRRSVFVVTQH